MTVGRKRDWFGMYNAMKKMASKTSPATVIALIALFVSLGGTATATLMVTSKTIKNGTIQGKDIRKGQIASKQIKDGSIKSKDLAENAAGPSGQEGPAGSQGAQGLQGAPGDGGSSSVGAMSAGSSQLRYAASVNEDGSVSSSYSDGATPTITPPETGSCSDLCKYEFDFDESNLISVVSVRFLGYEDARLISSHTEDNTVYVYLSNTTRTYGEKAPFSIQVLRGG